MVDSSPSSQSLQGERLCSNLKDGQGDEIARQAFTVQTRPGHSIVASLYKSLYPAKGNALVIFSHGNAMDQNACFSVLGTTYIFSLGLSLCTFDFAGCGKGTEEFITMGWREKDELGCVINHLKSQFGCRTIILWGLSMGGFTSFMTLSQRSDVALAVIDSAYSSIGNCLKAWVHNDQAVYDRARAAILQESGFHIEELSAVVVAPQVKIPVLFIHGVLDKAVAPSESKTILDALGSLMKKYVTFPGGHASFRREDVYQQAVEFITTVLGV
jgi:pimeloyl-ACP methyl ester carboxylesterase